MSLFEALLSVFVGIGLSAACGLRVFIPPLGANLAALSGHLPLADGFAWLGSPLVTAALGAAALLEAGAYYIPWLDHLLDTVATPMAIGAGTLLTASTLGDASPFLQWALGLVAGGGSAGAVQGGTVMLRGASTATTGGLGNALVTTGETGTSLLMTALAIIVPVLAVGLLVAGAVVVVQQVRRRRSGSHGTS